MCTFLFLFIHSFRCEADNEDSSSGNVIATSASKLFDITYSMRDVERDLEALNSAIIEDLQRHESMAAMTGRLLAVCDSLTSLFNEVQEARRRVRLDDAHDPDDNRAVDADHRRRLREIISEIVDTRDDVVAEITSVDQGVVFLMTRLEAMAAGVKFENVSQKYIPVLINSTCIGEMLIFF